MRESELENALVRYALDRGFLHLKLNVRGRKGWPDQLFIGHGQTFFIEFKAPGEKLRPTQKYVINLLIDHGAKVYVFDSLNAAKRQIDELILIRA